MFQDLPTEILANIIGRLDNQSALTCSRLNKKLTKTSKRYDLDKPVVDELKIYHNKDAGIVTATYTLQMSLEMGQIEKVATFTLESEEVNQQEIIDWAFAKVRSVKKLSLTNIELDNNWINFILEQKSINRSIECLYLRNITCPVNVNIFYNLVDSIDLLDTDMDALATVEIGDITYEEFFSRILPSLSLFGDPDWIFVSKYTLNTLTDAFLPRLLEVLPKQFSLADSFTKISVNSLETTAKAAILSGAELSWHLGHFDGPRFEYKPVARVLFQNLPQTYMRSAGPFGRGPYTVWSDNEVTKIEFTFANRVLNGE